MSKYKGIPLTRKPNFMLIPVNTINMDSDGIKEFNELYLELKKSDLGTIIRSPSGGISYKTIPPAWDIRNTTTVVELTIIKCIEYKLEMKR